MKDAQYALLEKDRMIAEAQAKAEKELENARKEARSMISEHEIVRHAKLRLMPFWNAASKTLWKSVKAPEAMQMTSFIRLKIIWIKPFIL